MKIRIIPAQELSTQEREAIRSLDNRVDWGIQPDGRSFVWAESSYSTVVQEGDQLVSHVGIVERDVIIAGRTMAIAGIANVMTEPEFQGRGYARAGLHKATGFIRDQLSVPFALLLCLEHRRTLYESLGWSSIANEVYCDQAGEKILLTTPGRYFMQLPLTGEVPAGAIDLCGLPW